MEHQFEIGEISAVADDECARRDYRGNKNGRGSLQPVRLLFERTESTTNLLHLEILCARR